MRYGAPPHSRLYKWLEHRTERIIGYGFFSFWIVIPLVSVWGQRHYGDKVMFFIGISGAAVYAVSFALFSWFLARENDENPSRYGPSPDRRRE